MITPQRQVKIMDFGLAQLSDRTKLTATGMKLGTPAYMSAEQTEGRPADRRSDIWALGVVVYEMVSGRLPFLGEVEAAVAHAIVYSEPAPPTALRRGLPIEVDRVIGKALAKDPGDRHQHIDDLAVDLKNLQEKLKSGRSTILRTPNLGAGVPATLTAGQTLSPMEALPPGAVVVRRSSQRALQGLAAVTTLPGGPARAAQRPASAAPG
jgi:serine/threonine protein kinase